MDYGQVCRTAVRNLCANKARFWHAVLGMVIGVASVVFILGISNSLLNLNAAEEEKYAPGLINAYVYNHVDSGFMSITADDMERVVDERPDVLKAVSPYVMFELNGGVRYEGQEPEYLNLLGVDEDYIDMITPMRLQEGRFLEPMDIDRERNVCVVGSNIADELLGGDALGKTLKIWGENYTVVGVTNMAQSIYNEDYGVYIPYPNAQRMVGKTLRNENMYYQDHYFVLATGEETMYDAKLAIEEMCKQVTGFDKGRSVWSFAAYTFSGTVNEINGYIYGSICQLLLLAGIVLLIGGVGIMNVMLASVEARTKEIGIRKTFGATNNDIKRQFTLESVITGLIGGGLGILLGLAALLAVSLQSNDVAMGGGVYYSVSIRLMDLPILPVLAAVGVSVLIGVVFGTYTAAQAAKMEIVEAINSE